MPTETMMTLTPDSIALTDERWLRSLLAGGRRPNLLVRCDGPTAASVAAWVSALCQAPLEIRRVPGALDLPAGRRGTLLLHDVAALTLAQQMALYDWMSERWIDMQVISIASRPLLPLVHAGRFLEGLYYRLNVLYLSAALDRQAGRA
jgi:Sigma-54 interaction domain